MVKTKFMTINMGWRICKFISLVPRGGITFTNFTERNLVVRRAFLMALRKKGPYFRKIVKNQL